MKKLLSLMVLAAAAFAGGGLMNEHNLTTAVNYLYHKQQVGSVISLGSITSTPPAALPDHLPTVPGAVSASNAAGQPQAAAPAAGTSVNSTPAAKPEIAATKAPVVASPVPASPPPPLSVNWPDRTSSTYHTTPVAPASPEKAPPVATQTLPVETLPPASPSPAPLAAEALASASPVVPPPVLEQQPPAQPAKVDSQIMQAGFDASAGRPRGPVEPTWPELMRKLQMHGVGQISLTGTTTGKLKLKCELASADGLKSQAIEAEGDTPLMAAQVALKRVVLFKAARRASKSVGSDSAQTQPAQTAQAPQATIPQFSSPLPPAYVPPPPPPSDAPLPAPADVPN